ncbi:MAG: alpha/beta hydrolase, partial [Verrucomicrobiota bacterium]
MKSRCLLSFLILLLALSASSGDASAKVLSWSELSKMPLPSPGERVTYGNGPQHFGELRVPEGPGPFPVFILIHGGCWQNAFDYVYMTRLAAWLTEHGVATWTIEYRRLGDEGAGWPGTFLDVAHAADFVRELAPKHHLDTNRVFAAGHSAGGQLALWLAARKKLPSKSELFLKEPIAIQGVLGLAAITDLAQYRIGPPDSCHASVEPLLGGEPDKVPQRYAETSPRQLVPLGIRQIFIHGVDDPIVDPVSLRSYLDAAQKAGDEVSTLPIPAAGHFESPTILPTTEP